MLKTRYKTADICIATYKRKAQLSRCLESLLCLEMPEGMSVNIYIVDNDAEKSAKKVASEYAKKATFPIHYLVEPQKNISLARNASIKMGEGEIILFLDDDEIADPTWLKHHIMMIEKYNAGAVTGPVEPIYPKSAKHWVVKSKIFEAKKLPEGTLLKTAATNNTSVLRELIKNFSFSPSYGLTGGGDNDFFYRLSQSGVQIVWTDTFLVKEYLEEERVRIPWILKRGFRVGQSHTRIYYFNKPKYIKLFYMTHMSTLLTVSLARLGLGIFIGRHYMLKNARQVFLRAGRVLAFSKRYYVEYGEEHDS